eukprot:scaffold1287_cov253-Ochromonas_danica.AAC.3
MPCSLRIKFTPRPINLTSRGAQNAEIPNSQIQKSEIARYLPSALLHLHKEVHRQPLCIV